jgi:hypothetical protein
MSDGVVSHRFMVSRLRKDFSKREGTSWMNEGGCCCRRVADLTTVRHFLLILLQCWILALRNSRLTSHMTHAEGAKHKCELFELAIRNSNPNFKQ